MEEPVLVPKPSCTRELFRVLTTTEGLVAGLMLCGEPIDVRKFHYGEQKQFVVGIPIVAYSRKFQGGTLERELWWVVAQDGTSAVMTAPIRGVQGRWITTAGVSSPDPLYVYEHPKAVCRSIVDYLILNIYAGKLSIVERHRYVTLIGLIDRLIAGQLVL